MTGENSSQPIETAFFAGGCFWCVQEAFDSLDGVISTTTGYTGGHAKNPTYEQVCSEKTGHHEALKVVFDPSIISYQKLLEIFWHNIDPLDNEGQFNDRGDSYRSAIFYSNDEQKTKALKSKSHIEHQLKAPVATAIMPAVEFYPAEDYHQEYHKKNPIRYKTYRHFCGRDRRLKELWNDES